MSSEVITKDTLEAILNEVLPSPAGLKVESKASATFSVGANAAVDLTINVADSGYTPIGVVGYDFSGTGLSGLVPYRLKISGTNALVSLRNDSTTARSGMTATVYILYKKS